MWVSAFVDATDTSGPRGGHAPSHSRAIEDPTTLTRPTTRPPLRRISRTAKRVSAVAGLADDDVEGVRVDDGFR